MVFVNTSKELIGQYNMSKIYDGSLTFDFQWNGKFAVEDTALEGTGWLGGNMERVEAQSWHYYMQNQHTVKFPENLKERLSNDSLRITL